MKDEAVHGQLSHDQIADTLSIFETLAQRLILLFFQQFYFPDDSPPKRPDTCFSKMVMWLTKLFTAVMVVLTGLLPSSCTSTKGKSPAAQSRPSNTTNALASADNQKSANGQKAPINQDLGELELTNHYETYVQLGGGKSCTIKPNALDHKNLQLTMALQSKSSDGKTTGLNVIQVVTRQGKSFEVAIGDMNLTLTPRLVE